jgi:uncharacterized UBP type Zn finger protein
MLQNEKIEQLVSMGFDSASVVTAMDLNGGNVDSACNYLLKSMSDVNNAETKEFSSTS